MDNIKGSDFCFVGYKIKHSEININGDISNDASLKVHIVPKGQKSKEEFILTLNITIKDEVGESVNINIIVDGHFKFRENIDINQLGRFFTVNAPAIIFPYIRGYISMLSSLSGITPILLPTLNLQQVGLELAGNIEEIKE